MVKIPTGLNELFGNSNELPGCCVIQVVDIESQTARGRTKKQRRFGNRVIECQPPMITAKLFRSLFCVWVLLQASICPVGKGPRQGVRPNQKLNTGKISSGDIVYSPAPFRVPSERMAGFARNCNILGSS